ncbi:MAG: lysophospholipid acyltransferase family protein [Planctomycetota bacterium]
MFDLDRQDEQALRRQDLLGRLNAFWVIPLMWVLLRVIGRYRIAEIRKTRQTAEALRSEAGDRPLLICGNHLTMIDSLLIAWSLASTGRYVVHFDLLPWNMPELENFGRKLWLRLLCFLGRCIYVERRGTLASKKRSLAQAHYLLRRGDPVLIFPEGGRSRTGFVKEETSATGVGRLLQSLPDLQVLCVYLRGRAQQTYSYYPRRGEVFDVSLSLFRPTTELTGGAGAKDLTRKILDRLRELEGSVSAAPDEEIPALAGANRST